MDIYGAFILTYLYILIQNKFNLVKCVVVTIPELTPSQLISQPQVGLAESEEDANSDDSELNEQLDSLESSEISRQNNTNTENSNETSEKPPPELPNDIKITTEGSTKINDKSKFVLHKWTRANKDYYKIEFNEDTKCSQVEVEDSLIWKYTGGYRRPLTILYEPKISLVLKFYNGYSKYDKTGNSNEWLEECDLKLYTADPFDITKSIKLDNTKYKTRKEGTELLFEFEPSVQCNEVRFVEKKPDRDDPNRIHVIFKTVWKRWSTFGDESPTIDFCPSSVRYKNHSRVILTFLNGILIRERDTKNNWHTLAKEIKMYTFGPENPLEFVEIDHSQYLNKILDGSFNCEFKPEVKCVEVKVDEHSLWKFDGRSAFNKFPREVSYGRILNRVILRYETCSVIYFKGRENNWLNYKNYNYTDINNLVSTVDYGGFPSVWDTTGSDAQKVPESISTDASGFGMAWDTFGEFIDQEVYDTNDPGSFPTGWHTYDYGGVERGPKPQQNTLGELYSDIDVAYPLDQGSEISSLTQTERSQMQIKDRVNKLVKAKRQRDMTKAGHPNERGTEASRSTGIDDMNLTQSDLIDLIMTMNDELESLKKAYSDLRDQLERASEQENKTPISLDISSEKSTNQIKCTKQGDKIFFIPMVPHAFKMVKMDTMVIWHTLKPNEYAIKVEVTPGDKIIVHKLDGNKEEMEIKAKNERVKISNETTPPLKGLYDEEIEMESDFMRQLHRRNSHKDLEKGARRKHPLEKQDSHGSDSERSLDNDYFDIDVVDPAVDDSPNKATGGQQPGISEYGDHGERLFRQYHEPKVYQRQPKIPQSSEPQRIETQWSSEPKIQLIILELTDRESSNLVRYEVNHNKRREKFTCIPPNRVFRVVHKGEHVWTSPNNSYPDRVLVKPGPDGTQMAYMFLPGDIDEGVDDGPDVVESGVAQPKSLLEDFRPVQKQLEGVQPVEQHLESMGQEHYHLQYQQQQQKLREPQQQLQHQQPEEREQSSNWKLITVEVDKLKSTSDVDYWFDKSKNAHRFIAKDWCLIEKVIKGGKVVWTPKTNYGIEVEVKLAQVQGEKDKLVVYYDSDNSNPKNPTQV